MPEPKNITCPKCSKDNSVEKFEETGGRCPECGFNYQLFIDMGAVDEVRNKSKKQDDLKTAPKKNKLWI